MKSNKEILIIYGSLNSVPSPEGAAPAKIIYETVKSSNSIKYKVLSNFNEKLKGVTYDYELFYHVKPNLLDRVLLILLKFKFSYKERKLKFVTGSAEQLLYFISVCRFLRKQKHDKIIIHVAVGLVAMVKWVFPKKEIIFYHHGTSLHSKLNEVQWSALIHNAKAIIGVNNIALIEANTVFKEQLDSSRYFKINNAILNESRQNIKNKALELKVDTSKFNFAFTGRICIEKGVLNLLKAFKNVYEQHATVCLYIVGSAGTKALHTEATPYLLECNNYVSEHMLPVIFTGYLGNSELMNLVMKLDVVVCPTDRNLSQEGMPLSIIESLALAKPVIATDSGGNSEVVIDGENGLISKEYPYIADLSEKMLRLVNDKSLYKKLSEGAYKSFEHKHTYKVYNRNIEAVLKKVGFKKEEI